MPERRGLQNGWRICVEEDKRLRVLWLSHMVPYPPKGGLLMRGYYLLEGLSRYHDVDLFAFNQKKLISSYYASVKEGIDDAVLNLSRCVRSVEVTEIPADEAVFGREILALKSLCSGHTYTINWLKSAFARQRIQSLRNERIYDVVHFDTISLAPYLLQEENVRLKFVLNHHNVESDMLIRRAGNSRAVLKAWYYRQEGERLRVYEKSCLRKFDLHLACSKEDKDALLRIDPSIAVEVVPNVVPVPEAPCRSVKNEKKLLFIGGMDWYPNRDAVHHFLDEIWPVVSVIDPDVTADFVGKNPSEKMLAAQASDGRLRFHGFVDDISEFYRDAAVYICPIRDGGGTKLKVIDAMGNALPVIAYKEACEGLDVTDGIHAFIALSAKSFAELIARLLSDVALGSSVGQNARMLVKDQYSAHSMGERMSYIYSSLCEINAPKSRR